MKYSDDALLLSPKLITNQVLIDIAIAGTLFSGCAALFIWWNTRL